jgi:hypothetical protein
MGQRYGLFETQSHKDFLKDACVKSKKTIDSIIPCYPLKLMEFVLLLDKVIDRTMDAEKAANLIETILTELNLDPILCRGDQAGKWSVRVGDAIVWINVFNFQADPDAWFMQVSSPLFKMPEKNTEAICIDLLELGSNMYSCGMVKRDDWFYVLSLQPLNELMPSTIDFVIDKVAFYRNDLFGKMDFKYAGSWSNETVQTED